jgi:hypothetical protein
MAKGIGNGVPLAAVVTTPEIAQALAARIHFNTFGGNPVVTAQGKAVLEVIEREGLQQNSLAIGEHFTRSLRRLAEKHSIIGDIRGKGLMLGVELVKDRQTKAPAKEETLRVFENAKRPRSAHRERRLPWQCAPPQTADVRHRGGCRLRHRSTGPVLPGALDRATMKLSSHRYGKSRVRVMKVLRKGATHTLKELDVSVALSGDFESSYTSGDNRLVIATDTMKNTVKRVREDASRPGGGEVYGRSRAAFPLEIPQVTEVEIDAAETLWNRMESAVSRTHTAFQQAGRARPFSPDDSDTGRRKFVFGYQRPGPPEVNRFRLQRFPAR